MIVAAAHPGYTRTNLQQHSRWMRLLNPLIAMQPIGGALPTFRAATAPDVESGDYYGPRGFYEMRGAPKNVEAAESAHNEVDAAQLWTISEERTGVNYQLLPTTQTT